MKKNDFQRISQKRLALNADLLHQSKRFGRFAALKYSAQTGIRPTQETLALSGPMLNQVYTLDQWVSRFKMKTERHRKNTRNNKRTELKEEP